MCHYTLASDVILTSMESHRARVHVTLSHSYREKRQSLSPQRCGHPIRYSIWGILQERVYRSRIYDVKELKERLLREWRLLDHSIIAAVNAQ